MKYLKRIGFALVGIMALLGGYHVSLDRSPIDLSLEAGALPKKSATLLAQPRSVVSFSLSDQTGKRFSTESIKGKWSFLSFGYTHCPNNNRTSLAILSRVDDQLKSAAVSEPYQVVFVSVDPERDTAQRLADYVSYFNPGFIGVRGDTGELVKLASQLGVLYVKVAPQDSKDDYLIDHSGSIILIDPDGRFHAIFGTPYDSVSIAEDFKKIIL